MKTSEETLFPPAQALNELTLAFLGVGWIGRNRMESILKEKLVKTAFVADTCTEMVEAAMAGSTLGEIKKDLDDIIACQPDGIVIATPSALHAQQSIQALNAGIPVFCQKPLGRTAEETAKVVLAAQRTNTLLGLDLSYRYTQAIRAIQELIFNEELGHIYGINLVFHNAYGPDKEWFYNPTLSGGGCVIDLGVHLIDLALWLTGFPKVENVCSQLFSKGQIVTDPQTQVEDYATAQFSLATGASVQLNCSWNLSAGQDAQIEASFYGTRGGARFRNVNGSFYDFVAEQFKGTETTTLCAPPDEWGGRAAVEWAKQVTHGNGFNPNAIEFIKTAEIIDIIYGRQ